MVTRYEPARQAHAWRPADFVGGHPALDFLNTVADTSKTRDEDKLVDWPAVRAWAGKSGLLAAADLTRFLRHPHTLRDCSVPRARAECWRGSASASTARKPTRAHSRRRNEQLA